MTRNLIFVSWQNDNRDPSGQDDEERVGAVRAGPVVPPQPRHGRGKRRVGMKCLNFHTNTKPHYRNERNCTEGIKPLWRFIVSTVNVVGRSITMLVGLIKH